MAKFEYEVIRYSGDQIVWKRLISIRAENKLEARALIEQIFPSPEYSCKFVQTC